MKYIQEVRHIPVQGFSPVWQSKATLLHRSAHSQQMSVTPARIVSQQNAPRELCSMVAVHRFLVQALYRSGDEGPDRSMHPEEFGELPGLAMRKWGWPAQMPLVPLPRSSTSTAADLNIVLASFTVDTALRNTLSAPSVGSLRLHIAYDVILSSPSSASDQQR